MTDTPRALVPFLKKISERGILNRAEAHEAFTAIMDGQATPAQIAGFLVALRMRGERVEEITAAVDVIRARALSVKAPANAMDIVGTGGDGSGTLNISTATAFVVAGCGIPVAKHGNRALSSRSGAADVLGALGINLDCEFPLIEQAIAEAGIGFMLAPRHHPSFRHVGPVRAELGIRTLFNLLGPLCNPAGVKRYLLGVYAEEWVRPLAETLAAAGAEKAWVVHGAGGLDELSTLGPNAVCEVSGGQVREFSLDPAELGLPTVSLADLQGGDGEYNATRLRQLLAGQQDAYRDVVLLNAAAALVVADTATDMAEGLQKAATSIDQGHAAKALQALVSITRS